MNTIKTLTLADNRKVLDACCCCDIAQEPLNEETIAQGVFVQEGAEAGQSPPPPRTEPTQYVAPPSGSGGPHHYSKETQSLGMWIQNEQQSKSEKEKEKGE